MVKNYTREIDTIIEMNDGTWHAFEIKLGANQIDDATYQREDGVYVVPITALKQ